MEVKKYQLKSKYYYALCLGNSSKDFTINNIKKKIGLTVIVNIFSVDLTLLIPTIFSISINIS